MNDALFWVAAVLAWHLARSYVFGSIDPHLRLYAWLDELWSDQFKHVGWLIWLALWIVWPVVAWRYCKDNPQERAERSFRPWTRP